MLPETAGAPGTDLKPASRYRRILAYREKHPGTEIAVFFAAGFLFDVVTLTRVDDLFTLVQQGVYLVMLTLLMVQEERYAAGVAAPPRLLAGAWRYAEDAIHFLLGSLLSVFTLFYLKSTSGLTSLLFLGFLCALLVANELPRFRRQGPVVRFALLSLCMATWLALLLPIVAGFLSVWLFLAAVALSCGAFVWLVRRLSASTKDAPAVWRRVGAPAFAMQGLLAAAYFVGLIPPVPLSVQFIGIYHEVVPPGAGAAPVAPETSPAPQQAGIAGLPTPGAPAGGGPGSVAPAAGAAGPASRAYQLRHLRPWWRFWHHGDQDFAARPGDVVYCFARVFAPKGFRDAVYMRWLVERRDGAWEDQGRARLTISGGRGEGFRAFGTKRNYRPGRWRVEVETEDGRDLGVIHFRLAGDDSTGPREFSVDAG